MTEGTAEANRPGKWVRSRTDAEDHQNWDRWISTYREWAAQNLHQLYPTLTVTNQWTILITTGGSDLESIIHKAGIDTVSLVGATPTPIEEGIRRISDIMEPLSTSILSHPEAKTEADETRGTRESCGDTCGGQTHGRTNRRGRCSSEEDPKGSICPGPTCR